MAAVFKEIVSRFRVHLDMETNSASESRMCSAGNYPVGAALLSPARSDRC